MAKKKMKHLLHIFAIILAAHFFINCSYDDIDTIQKAERAREKQQLKNIYNILEEYPALNSLFTSGNLSRREFEHKFLYEFLGDQDNADLFIKLLNIFPHLFESRTVPEKYFNSDASDAMKQGIMPDFMNLTARYIDLIYEMPGDQKIQIYSFFDTIAGIEMNPIIQGDLYNYSKELMLNTGWFLYENNLPDLTSDPELKKLISDFLIVIENIAFDYPDSVDHSISITKEFLFNCMLYIASQDDTIINEQLTTILDYLKTMYPADYPDKKRLYFTDIDDFFQVYLSSFPDISKLLPLIQSQTLLDILKEYEKLTYNHKTRSITVNFIESFGNYAAHDDNLKQFNQTLQNITTPQNSLILEETLNRLINDGPIVGDAIADMGIPGYGQNYLQDTTLRKLMLQTDYLNDFSEWMYRLQSVGYPMDKVGEQLKSAANDTPFCQPRDGSGEFGNGQFYKPAPDFSYRNYSWLKGIVNFASRFGTPLSFTSPFLFETGHGAVDRDKLTGIMREWIPDIDSIPMTAFLWVDIYEKDPFHQLGHGQPVREKRGYGQLIDDGNGEKQFIAPVMPAIQSIGGLAAFMVAESIYHGPHDNIYDNFRWCLYERDYYMVIDLAEMLPHIPRIYDLTFGTPFGDINMGELFEKISNQLGWESVPIVLFHSQGAQPILHLELHDFFDGLPESLSISIDILLEELDDKNQDRLKTMLENAIPHLKGITIELMQALLPVGHSVEGSNKAYLLPQDIRDLWTTMNTLCFYDKDAFHADRFTDLDNPERYRMHYDVSDYTYEDDYDKINTIFPVVAAAIIAAYENYIEVARDFEPTLSDVPAVQKAARESFGNVIFLSDYLVNILGSFNEIPNDVSPYTQIKGDKQLSLVTEMEKLLDSPNSGLIDNFFESICFLGRPENTENRLSILKLINRIADENYNSDIGYHLTENLINLVNDLEQKPHYRNAVTTGIKIAGQYLSGTEGENKVIKTIEAGLNPDNDILPSFVALAEHIHNTDPSQFQRGGNIHNSTQWMFSISDSMSEERMISRTLMALTDLLDLLHKTEEIPEITKIIKQSLTEGGLIHYIVNGLNRKDIHYTWDEIFFDAGRFFNSDIMSSFDPGSFWNDICFLVDFMTGKYITEELF